MPKTTSDDAPEEGSRGATKEVLLVRSVESPLPVAWQSGLIYPFNCGSFSRSSSDV